ncbi:hypothetical protein MRX96_023265 [Rhipicephalus microplus]
MPAIAHTTLPLRSTSLSSWLGAFSTGEATAKAIVSLIGGNGYLDSLTTQRCAERSETGEVCAAVAPRAAGPFLVSPSPSCQRRLGKDGTYMAESARRRFISRFMPTHASGGISHARSSNCVCF